MGRASYHKCLRDKHRQERHTSEKSTGDFCGVKFGSASHVQGKVSMKACEDLFTLVTVSEIQNLAVDVVEP